MSEWTETRDRLRAYYGRPRERAFVPEGQAVVPSSPGFLAEVSGRTILTAPATLHRDEWAEKAQSTNPHMMWMTGRFVGAEKANRNGALWQSKDLELGNLTVRHGPLNWLHDARHVIGSIADARFIDQEAAADQALDQPYIQATSGIWRWLYPDEARVVEMASEAGKLWYSMECISESVACVGENGCGHTASYQAYSSGDQCQHMKERSAVRHFINPIFLGGAVIVPPARPGWAEAEATVMRQAASLAEDNAEAAGDMTATEWEQLMASVIKYALI